MGIRQREGDLSQTGGQAGAGRKLMALRQRMPGANPYELGRMRAQAIRLLFRLGNPEAAVKEARLLCDEQPGKAYSWMVMGDACAMAGAWREALDSFVRASVLRREAGQIEDAVRTELGPAYRMAEGLGELDLCLDLTGRGGGGLLGDMLLSRASRLSGKASGNPAVPPGAGFLIEGIHILESCHRGAKPWRLPDLVLDWGPAEPEWRWRLLAEGVMLFRDCGLAVSPWKKTLDLFEGPVLDPRFTGERKAVLDLVRPPGNQDFVQ